jgi:DNA polymerase-3 subunit epsilon
MTAWYEGPLTALALRSRPPASGAHRGADPERDRLCAAAVAAQQAPDAPVEMHSRSAPSPHVPLADDVARSLAAHPLGRPLVVLRAPYDLTLLDRELRRQCGTPLTDGPGGRSLCVLDPVLLDVRLRRAPGRPAQRRGLAQLCAHYGVSAPADTVEDEAAAGLALARAVGRRFALRLRGLPPATLHTLQAGWFAAEAGAPTAWFTTGTRRAADRFWPLLPPPPP